MSETIHRALEIQRVPSGVPGLDVLLDGGFLRGATYLAMGRPGTGKTTMGNQLAFAHVAQGGRAVYVTLLAESHARMLANLQSMRFFRDASINEGLTYVGAYAALREKKLPGLLELLRRVIRDERASLLVVDGFASTEAFASSAIAAKEFIVELQTLCSMTECTAVVLSNQDASDANGAEHTMVDGLIELTVSRVGQRTLREFEVIKFRGSNHMLGRHDMEITDAGIVVYPRTEELFARNPRAAPRTRTRRSTGIAELDAMLGGGVLAGSTTMLLGFAGSGKTMLATHFLDAGAEAGEPGLHFGFYESPPRLIEGADHLGLSFGKHVESGRIDILWQPPLRYGLDALAERLFANVRARGVKRLVIDGLDGFRQAAVHPERVVRYVTAVVQELRALGVTTYITEETQKLFGPEVEIRIEGMSALVENIILLEYLDIGAQLSRLLSIVKQRASGYETSIRELCITDRGIELASNSESAERILAGTSELQPRTGRRPTAHGAKPARGSKGTKGMKRVRSPSKTAPRATRRKQ